MKLTATREFTYATRRLKPGDDFEAPAMQARALIGVKKARAAEEAAPPPPARSIPRPAPDEPHDEDEHEQADERERLRDLAAALGIEVNRRWGVERLREAIEQHRGDETGRTPEPDQE